jgi:KaiC/GvpD/RAD55 family RecA-like ATPase
VDRVSTGIAGLDDHINGGYPRGRTILVSGDPGSGKTTFGLHFLVDGIVNHKENGVLVTLMEEPKDILLENAAELGFDLAKYESDGALRILDVSPVKVVVDREMTFTIPVEESALGAKGFHVGELISLINKNIMEINAKRVVIDSITPLMLSKKDPFEVRYDVITIIKALDAALATSLLTAESEHCCEECGRVGSAAFLTDGVISLRTVREGNEVSKRYMDIVKMLGSSHSLKPIEYEMRKTGIQLKTR